MNSLINSMIVCLWKRGWEFFVTSYKCLQTELFPLQMLDLVIETQPPASPWGPTPLSMSEPWLPCCCPFCPAMTQPLEWEPGAVGWASIGAENLAGHWNRSYQSGSQSIHTEAAFEKHQRWWLKGGIRLWMERDLIHGWSSSSGSPLTPSWAY